MNNKFKLLLCLVMGISTAIFTANYMEIHSIKDLVKRIKDLVNFIDYRLFTTEVSDSENVYMAFMSSFIKGALISGSLGFCWGFFYR